MWLGWILASCVVLGFYDLSKKASVSGNAVFPTLFFSTFSGFAAVTAFIVARGEFAATVALPANRILLLLIKSCLVGASWSATYMALRTLPITSAAPIRATGPLWTLLGAILIFSEVPTCAQIVGMAMVMVGCVVFAWSTTKEGVSVWKSPSIALAFLGTVLGSCSALYDKHLLQQLAIPTSIVLWWFMGGMCIIYAIIAMFNRQRFEWRWTIPAVGILLAFSDACYFNAIGTEGARISVLSMIRRASVILTFFVGGAVFRETNLRRKALALAAILAGVAVLCLWR